MPRNSFKAHRPPSKTFTLSFGDKADVPGFLAAQDAEETGSPGVQNLANAMQAREQRIANQLQNPGLPIVSTNDDMGWDAFFGGMQHQKDLASQHGLKFGTQFGGVGNDPMPQSILGLKSALTGY